MDGSSAHVATHVKYCRTVVNTGDPVYPASNSFILPINSTFVSGMSNGTLRLLEQGKLESLEDYFERRGQCVLPDSTVITWEKMKIFFYLAYIATALVLIEMIFDPQELANHYRNRCNHEQNDQNQSASGEETSTAELDKIEKDTAPSIK